MSSISIFDIVIFSISIQRD